MRAHDRNQWAVLVAVVTDAVNRTDPMGLLSLGAPDDEYESEISDLLAGLAAAWPNPTAVLHLCRASIKLQSTSR